MYAMYLKSLFECSVDYTFVEELSLFGCNRGIIPKLLRLQTNHDQSEPFRWRLDLEDALVKLKKPDHCLIIDLKPNNVAPNLSFYEIVRVWGVSDGGWTPIMMQLRMLFGDNERSRIVDGKFRLRKDEIDEPIFSMMYLNGSVDGGHLKGRWTPPGPSSTNSVLLWPDTFDFFASEMADVRREMSKDLR